jgi:tRNA-splicing endonuclease subunit Sen2
MHLPADLIKMDNTFIVNYVAYHYYRSKAWVIKDGIKFGVDYSMYISVSYLQGL